MRTHVPIILKPILTTARACILTNVGFAAGIANKVAPTHLHVILNPRLYAKMEAVIIHVAPVLDVVMLACTGIGNLECAK